MRLDEYVEGEHSFDIFMLSKCKRVKISLPNRVKLL